eukprot:4094912-Amphidinium_carterae.1
MKLEDHDVFFDVSHVTHPRIASWASAATHEQLRRADVKAWRTLGAECRVPFFVLAARLSQLGKAGRVGPLSTG